MDQYIQQLKSIVSKLYSKYVKTIKNPGVLLSGGIDSSLISYFVSQYFSSYSILSMGTEKTKDLSYVKGMCDFLHMGFEWVDLTERNVGESLPIVIKLLDDEQIPSNLMQLSLACGYFLLFKRAKELDIRYIFTGQGPDILFAGYHKYKSIKNVNVEIKKDMPLLEVDKKRDSAMARYFGISLINPYLEPEMVAFSLTVPAEYKLHNGVEKYILRELAKMKGLPDSIVQRPKKAFQYSTGIQNMVRKYSVANF